MFSVILVQLVQPPPEMPVTSTTLLPRRPATIMRSPTATGTTVPVLVEVMLTGNPVARVATAIRSRRSQ